MLKNYSSSEGVTADVLVYKGTKVGFRLELNTLDSLRFFITSLYIFIFCYEREDRQEEFIKSQESDLDQWVC